MQHFYSSKSLVESKQGIRFRSESTSTKLSMLILFMALFFGLAMKAEAQVTVTPATGGTGLSVDRAANSTNPVGGVFTSITNIVLQEPQAAYFTPSTFTKLVIDAPANWTFNPGVGTPTVIPTNGQDGDIYVTTFSITSSTITVNFAYNSQGNNNAVNKIDRIFISGLQVKATSGAIIPSTGNITSSLTGTTSLGTLSQGVGVVARLAFSTQPITSTYGSPIVGFPTVQTQDQYGNPSTIGLGSTLSVALTTTTGTGTLSNNALNIGTSGGNGTATFNNLLSSTSGSKVITASATGFTSAASSSFIINPKPLTITGISGVTKVYDGLTPCVLSGTASLVGVINNDAVTLSGVGTGSFLDANAGSTKAVAVTGYTITGGSSSNYTLTQPTLSASITQRPLTISGIVATSKEYDSFTACALSGATLQNTISGDAISLVATGVTANFDNKNIGTGKLVTLSGTYALDGAAAGNYSLAQPVPSLSANITPRTLSLENVTTTNRIYDGTAVCPLVINNASIFGIVGSEDVRLIANNVAGTFLNKNVADDKEVTISGYSIGGNDAGNYLFRTPTLLANVSKRNLTVDVLSENKTDSKGNPIVSLIAVDLLSGDTVNLNYDSARYATDPATNYKSITVSGIAISGKDAGNYSLATNQAMGINPLPVTLVSFTGKYSKATGVTLNWSTASEKDNDYFQVERSLDGKTFTTVGKVKGNGNSNMLLKYQFVDGQALNGTVYYRLRQVDFDGKFEYSKVIAVNGQGGALAAGAMKAYPNPTFTGKVTLEVGRGQGGTAKISVVNGAGQVLSSEEVMLVEGQRYEVDLTQQKAGMYYLQVENGTGRSINRIVKQ
ncbi:YDG domain-containing protein [Nibribacter koreensis]|uniref:Por secretion system C-terminal sorting domain-containing protein n=1 Tax=Nibribacter koreensis TaxID=1084519 RepID=A0ABP8FLV0_9BACT